MKKPESQKYYQCIAQAYCASPTSFKLSERLALLGMPRAQIDDLLEGLRKSLMSLRRLHGFSRSRVSKNCTVPEHIIEQFETTGDVDEHAFDLICAALGIGIEMPAPASEMRFGILSKNIMVSGMDQSAQLKFF